MAGIAVAIFAVIGLRLWYLEVLSGDKYREQANDNRISEVRRQAPRGDILDRDGKKLVVNRTEMALQVQPDEMPKVGSPKRTEIMTGETAGQIITAVRRFRFKTVDITGGAPELNPSFRRLVAASREAGAHVIVRHNLTVMFEPKQDDLPEFFREHEVEVVSSLPYFLEQQTDAQRGHGVFAKSLAAMRRAKSSRAALAGSPAAGW